MKVKVIEEDRHPGEYKTIGEFVFARVPVKGDYLIIDGKRVLVDWVDLYDGGEVVVRVS